MTNKPKISDLEKQPKEITELILMSMPIESVINLCRTNLKFKAVCDDENLWGKLLKRDFGDLKPEKNMDMYIKHYKNKKQIPAVKKFLKNWIMHYDVLDITSQNRLYDKFIKLLRIQFEEVVFEYEGPIVASDVILNDLWEDGIYDIINFIRGDPFYFYKSSMTPDPDIVPTENTVKTKFKNDIEEMYVAWIVSEVNLRVK